VRRLEPTYVSANIAVRALVLNARDRNTKTLSPPMTLGNIHQSADAPSAICYRHTHS
jgi:hypothetical protein